MPQLRMSPNRQNLMYEGLSAMSPMVTNRHKRRYRVYFVILTSEERLILKAKAIVFLQREYEAYDFEFFASMVQKERGFYCEFTSFAVEGI